MEKPIKIGNKVCLISSDDDYLEAVGNDFEPYMVQLFRALIGQDDVVADIGANIGLTAILFSALAKQVYAFEHGDARACCQTSFSKPWRGIRPRTQIETGGASRIQRLEQKNH